LKAGIPCLDPKKITDQQLEQKKNYTQFPVMISVYRASDVLVSIQGNTQPRDSEIYTSFILLSGFFPSSSLGAD